MLAATVAPAQDPARETGAASGALEEVTVTARKRVESLQDVPLSISVFNAEAIEDAGFRDLADVANFTPGLQFHKQAAQRTGRINSSIRIRGMNVNSEAPAFQLASLFMDGIYVMGGISSIGLDDVERIEVIKGPQAAYFGRNTFGGAVNYITKNPGTDWLTKLNLSLAEYGDHEANASVEGPILGEALRFRVSLRDYRKGPQWTANDGGELGRETTKSVTATLFSEPTENWWIRVRGNYLEDDDGPAATAYLPGNRFDSCSNQLAVDSRGNPIFIPLRNAAGAFIPGTSSGVQARRGRYICGAIPTLEDIPFNIISTNTTLTPRLLALAGVPNLLRDVYITRTFGTALAPTVPNATLVGSLGLDGFGLKRFSRRFSVQTEYTLPNGIAFYASVGNNKERVNYLRDFDNTDVESFWEADPRDLNDESWEVRIASPQEGRLKWLIGYNKYQQTFTGDGSGGLAISSCYASNPPGGVLPPCNNLFPTTLTNGVFVGGGGRREARSEVDTTGIFGAISYDFNEQWSLQLEGRQYEDEITRFNTTSLVPIPPINYVVRPSLTEKQEEFLPRVILQFKPRATTNLYLSYSRGILPGEINALYAFGTDAAIDQMTGQPSRALGERAQYEAVLPNIANFTGPEKITAYEIGWKQELLDGRARFALAYYVYPKWENQKGRVVVNVFETNRTATSPNFGRQNPAPNARNVLVTGESELQGVELEGAWRITDRWDVQLGAEWTKNEYKNFTFNFVAPLIADLRSLAGTPVLVPGVGDQMAGNRAPNYPEWKATLVSTYSGNWRNDWRWFARGEFSFQGKYFVDESNLAWMPATSLANARFGLERERLRTELFITNLFDSDKWARASRFTDFSVTGNIFFLTAAQGVLVTPQDKRQFGVRVAYEF
ncbi:MAG: TonB-dependent receptor [Steroidobacteraceae bacterium]|nr:TonB-dependent receptor [Steroidobacteraceae bacterium]